MLRAGENLKTLRNLAWIARGLIIAAFFVMWKRLDFDAIEAFKYCFSAYVILHALMRVLVPIARVFDRARSHAMIAVGIGKFLVSLLLPTLWKGFDVPFWRSLTICGVLYFALDRVWRYLDKRATSSGYP